MEDLRFGIMYTCRYFKVACVQKILYNAYDQTLRNTLDPILGMGSFASFLYDKRENRQ